MKKTSRIKDLSPSTVCAGHDAEAIREFLAKIGDKWSIFLIVALSHLPGQRARFSEIEKSVPGISQRMLTTTLKNLVRDGLLTREMFPEVPPRVEYALTDMGRSLLVPMKGIVDWIGNNWPAVKKSREKFDATLKKK